MQALTDVYKLKNGVSIPCIGFGTWQVQEGQEAVAAVQEALRTGYRHIDTAAVYENEHSVGVAIRKSGIPREDIFVTTKLANSVRGYKETLAAFDESLQKLGLSYLDLYLVHWPNPVSYRDNWRQANAESWRAMEDLYHQGKVRAIGVSNFRPHHLEALLQTAKVEPMVNQLRLCPGETQSETTEWCTAHGILLEAYSPLGRGLAFSVPQMQALAQKYGRSIAQICIRWCLQMGYLPLPKSVTAARMRENLDVFNFSLSPEDVRLIAGLHECCGPTQDPDTATF